MNNENMPQWLGIILAVVAAFGGKELLSYYQKQYAEDKRAETVRKELLEDSSRELSNKSLLDMIEGLKTDMDEQKNIEKILREQLMKEMTDKVKFQTRLEMLLDQIEKNERINN